MAVTEDTFQSNPSTASSSSFTYTFTPTTHQPSCVVVSGMLFPNSVTITGMTYGGVAMTQELSLTNGVGDGSDQYLFVLAGPPSSGGSPVSIVVTYSGATSVQFFSTTTSFNGTTTSQPSIIRSKNALATSGAGPLSNPLSSVAGDGWFDMALCSFGGGSNLVTATGTQTVLAGNASNNPTSWQAAIGTTTNATYSLNGTFAYADLAVVLEQAAAVAFVRNKGILRPIRHR